MRIWRNWQTRMVQVHVIAISWRFKSSYPHPKSLIQKYEGFFIRRCSLMVKHQLPKLRSGVRFPSPASTYKYVNTLFLCSCYRFMASKSQAMHSKFSLLHTICAITCHETCHETQLKNEKRRDILKCSPFVRQCGIIKIYRKSSLTKGDIFMPKGIPNKNYPLR